MFEIQNQLIVLHASLFLGFKWFSKKLDIIKSQIMMHVNMNKENKCTSGNTFYRFMMYLFKYWMDLLLNDKDTLCCIYIYKHID